MKLRGGASKSKGIGPNLRGCLGFLQDRLPALWGRRPSTLPYRVFQWGLLPLGHGQLTMYGEDQLQGRHRISGDDGVDHAPREGRDISRTRRVDSLLKAAQFLVREYVEIAPGIRGVVRGFAAFPNGGSGASRLRNLYWRPELGSNPPLVRRPWSVACDTNVPAGKQHVHFEATGPPSPKSRESILKNLKIALLSRST